MEQNIARETLKKYLPDYVLSVTSKSKGANMYVCPLCDSGKGKNGSGAFSIKDDKWHCFSCGASGDIFDLIGKIENITDYTQQLKRASELFGINLETYTHTHTHTEIHTRANTQTPTNEETNQKDFFLQAHKDIEKTDYPQRRGLSKETIDRFKLGYVAEWRHPKTPKAPATPRLIIPTSETSYLARDTRESVPDEQKQYSKSKVGAMHIFNRKAIRTATKPIFIVEGEIDALSIIEVGGEAVALGSTTMVGKFLRVLAEETIKQPFIIALDNDKSGEKATSDLEKGFKELNIEYYIQNITGQYKDANECLQKDREGLKTAVMEAENIKKEAEQIAKENYLATSTAHHLQNFINGITESVNTPFIPTGIETLDDILDGGLYEGLYIVGAISSLGKTTLVTQIADQIAEAGNDVLIFSLEMARTEIMAKSISRHTLQHILSTGGNMANAKTTRGITTGKRYVNYNPTEKEIIGEAIKKYGSYAEHIYISEGVGDIGVSQIRETIEKHILFTGRTPIVVIDYLQILAPHSERMTDKQNTDKAVMELKRISRDFKVSIIGISSFNRSSYKEAVTMEAFKESGAIEYSSDVLIGLQLEGAGTSGFDVNKAKAENPRNIELVILKNRNGATGKTVSLKYYPMFNLFREEKGVKNGDRPF